MSIAKNAWLMWHDLWSMLYPTTCCACDATLVRGEKLLCTKCLMRMPKTNFHKVRNNLIEKNFWGRIPIEHATSYFFFVKNSSYQHLLHKLKYKGRSDIGVFMGKKFGSELIKQPEYCEFDEIIPVPLHPNKMKTRGYNQSERIAFGLSKAMKIPVDTKSLKRRTFTETQTRKTRMERWENVSNVFEADPSVNLNNKHVLLVDDVLTTGATIEGCATALLAKNPRIKISVATLAFAHT